MKKNKVTVIREDEYEIEIGDSIWTQEQIKAFAKVMYPADNLEEIVEHVATMYFNQGEGMFLEGFGIPYVNGREPLFVSLNYKDAITKHININ